MQGLQRPFPFPLGQLENKDLALNHPYPHINSQALTLAIDPLFNQGTHALLYEQLPDHPSCVKLWVFELWFSLLSLWFDICWTFIGYNIPIISLYLLFWTMCSFSHSEMLSKLEFSKNKDIQLGGEKQLTHQVQEHALICPFKMTHQPIIISQLTGSLKI